ncbi:MAG: rhomboid family intramembrane serine protease [Oscillospiraceae bacterium]|nr:rhomboid family intramembrane serine protease [Oscillospiraceae bacterium]
MLSANKIFFQEQGKRLTPRNRNWLFAGSAFVIILNIALFAALGSGENWCYWFYRSSPEWEAFVPLNLLAALTSSFGHLSWSHVLMNAFAFLGCGLYLERRTGTLKLLLLVLIFAFFSAGLLAVVFNRANEGVGYSGVNYAFIAYIVLDYFTTVKRSDRFQRVFGGIAVFCLVLGSFVDAEAAGFPLAYYPVNLAHNVAHYSGLFAGAAIWAFERVVKWLERTDA